MLKHEITFEDFNGDVKKTSLYFNLTEAELIQLETETPEGLENRIQRLVDMKDTRQILEFVKLLIQRSYGIKSEDGVYFRKNAQILEDFESSAMYSGLLLSLFEDGGERLTAFITGVMPNDLIQRATAQMYGEKGATEPREPEKQYAPSAREVFAQQKIEPVDENVRPQGFNQTPTVSDTIQQANIPPHQSFQVKETPLEGATERAEFEAWKKQKEQAETNSISRPPHESGPGFIQQ